MKKIIAAAVLFGISFTAQAEKMYAVVGAGTASNWGTAFSVAGGYQVTTIPTASQTIPVAVEVGYQSLGSADMFGVSVGASALYAAAAGSYVINKDFTATGKLGFASVKTEVAIPQICLPFIGCQGGGTSSVSSTDVMFGVGMDYNLQKNLTVGAEYNSYGGESVLGVRAGMKF